MNPLPIELGFEKVLNVGYIAFDGLKLDIECSLEILIVNSDRGLSSLRKPRAVVQKNVLKEHESCFIHGSPHAT